MEPMKIRTAFPITMSQAEAKYVLEFSDIDGKIISDISKMVLAESPTLLQAQAMLVRAWWGILNNGRFSLPAQSTQVEEH